jgi:hypothetical protein
MLSDYTSTADNIAAELKGFERLEHIYPVARRLSILLAVSWSVATLYVKGVSALSNLTEMIRRHDWKGWASKQKPRRLRRDQPPTAST